MNKDATQLNAGSTQNDSLASKFSSIKQSDMQ